MKYNLKDIYNFLARIALSFVYITYAFFFLTWGNKCLIYMRTFVQVTFNSFLAKETDLFRKKNQSTYVGYHLFSDVDCEENSFKSY